MSLHALVIEYNGSLSVIVFSLVREYQNCPLKFRAPDTLLVPILMIHAGCMILFGTNIAV